VEIGVTSRVVVVVATEAQHRLRVDLSALLLPMLPLARRMQESQVRIIVVVGEVLVDIGVIIHMLGVKGLGRNGSAIANLFPISRRLFHYGCSMLAWNGWRGLIKWIVSCYRHFSPHGY
jgi:hypothetical protein